MQTEVTSLKNHTLIFVISWLALFQRKRLHPFSVDFFRFLESNLKMMFRGNAPSIGIFVDRTCQDVPGTIDISRKPNIIGSEKSHCIFSTKAVIKKLLVNSFSITIY